MVARPVANDPLVPVAGDSRPWRYAHAASGWALGALGALALLAWVAGDPDYLQLVPNRPTFHYNGAFAFLIWGGAHLALVRGWRRCARALGCVLVLGGAAIACAMVPGSGVRLDRWAFDLPRGAPPFAPAGVGGGLGLALVLGGAAVLMAARSKRGAYESLLGTLIGAFLVVSAPVTVLLAPPSGPILGPSGPALLGGVGSAVAGLALATTMLRQGTPRFVLGHALPLLVGLAGIGLTVALWAVLSGEQNRRVHRQVQFEAAHVQHLVLNVLNQEVARMAEVAEKCPDVPPGQVPESMRQDVGAYVGQTPGCLGVARIDAQLGVNWVERAPLVVGSLDQFGGGKVLTEAVQSGSVAVIRPPRSAWNGARVLLVYAPHRARAAGGGLLSVIAVPQLYANSLNASVAPGYGVTVSEGPDVAFARYGASREEQNQWTQRLPIGFHDHDWRLSVWPTQDALARESMSLPKLSLLTGLCVTALLALAVHLAQTARFRTFKLENEMRERKHAEHALRQSEEKYRTLIENLGQGIFLQDHEHRYVAANRQFCKSVGRAESEVIGATEQQLFDPERAARNAEEVRTVLAEGRSVETESEVLVGDQRLCVRRVLTPVRDATGCVTGVLGICWDVTEQRQLEAHVHQASKMDAIGQLAGGIAHDFNNLLTVILGNLELMLTDLAPEHPDHALVVSAQSAAQRAASLTQRLLGFARRHHLDWRPTNLNGVVAEVVALLQRTIDPLIQIETDLDPELWAVDADPTQLNQVLMNLCLNARDAIGASGRISIDTACVTRAEVAHPSGPRAAASAYVRLRVGDTGAGMTPEVKARIYEPFFTTKGVGKGTGLGLAMVFAIVRQHKGWIDCASEPGAGTRFDIYLPRCEGASAPEAVAAAPAPAPRPGRATVLVVDDEPLIRQLATAALESRGYTVLQAPDGLSGVDLYERERDRIDLVLLDLTMPVLSGHEAFRLILNLNPRARVLFVSGYSTEQLSAHEQEQMAGFVKKPYRPSELLAVVEDALLRRGSSSGHKLVPLAVS